MSRVRREQLERDGLGMHINNLHDEQHDNRIDEATGDPLPTNTEQEAADENLTVVTEDEIDLDLDEDDAAARFLRDHPEN